MLNDIPRQGAADSSLAFESHRVWEEMAVHAGLDVTGFQPSSSFAERVAWAVGRGLSVASALSRYSNKLSHSTEAQVLDNTRYAASHKMYLPPELICVDEAITGRRKRRDGVARMEGILKEKLAGVLLVYKISRLFRSMHQGLRFINEEVV